MCKEKQRYRDLIKGKMGGLQRGRKKGGHVKGKERDRAVLWSCSAGKVERRRGERRGAGKAGMR